MNRQINYIIFAGLFSVSFVSGYFSVGKKYYAGENNFAAIAKIINIDTTDTSIAVGKKIFESKCDACHAIAKDKTGPALAGVSDRWPDKKELFDFIKTPALVIARNEYAKKLKDKYRLPHPAYTLSDEEIQNVLDYIKDEENKGQNP